jgi:Flp pilus assembly pilin Flp
MTLILAVVGGLFIYVIFDRVLKRAFHRTQQPQKAIEVGTLIAAAIAVALAAGGLIYTQNTVAALQERVTALEKATQISPRVSP